jgi:hypothetical protein
MDFRITEERQRCRELAAEFATRSAAHDRDAMPPTEDYQRSCNEGRG